MYEDEVMGFDSCDGHTSRAEGDFGVYHYHNASRCLIPFSNVSSNKLETSLSVSLCPVRKGTRSRSVVVCIGV